MYRSGLSLDYTWPLDQRHSALMQSIEDVALQQPSAKMAPEAVITNDMPVGELRFATTKLIIERLSKLLFPANSDIDAEKGIPDYGMDSMIAAELRNWLCRMFALDISLLESLDSDMKILDLADIAVKAKEFKVKAISA